MAHFLLRIGREAFPWTGIGIYRLLDCRNGRLVFRFWSYGDPDFRGVDAHHLVGCDCPSNVRTNICNAGNGRDLIDGSAQDASHLRV
jgi:hypothetical protein